MMRAFIFPGQGSQNVGMGVELAQSSRVAREVFEEVDHIFSQNLFRLMAEGPIEELTLTTNAQPAIMAHSIALIRTIEHESGKDASALCEIVAGHSLGEYSALCAATAMDLFTTAKLLRARGDAMQAAVPPGKGGMAALLGATIATANKLAQSAVRDGEICELANDNDPTQKVISGHKEAIDRAVAMAKEAGIKRAVPLAVSAPLHSSLMEPAADNMAIPIAEANMLSPSVPIYQNFTAQPTQDVEEIRTNLLHQITGTVRWTETSKNMAEAGLQEVVEIGAKVVGPMVRRAAPNVMVRSVACLAAIENLLKEIT